MKFSDLIEGKPRNRTIDLKIDALIFQKEEIVS